jgi:hypothetical protein
MRLTPALILLTLASVAAPAQEQQPAAAPADERCSRMLVSYSDWPEVKNPVFLLGITTPRGKLYYFGAEHSADPAHPQFAEIEKAWQTFKPTAAFYEGPNRPVALTRDETIKQAGESGLVRFLAARDNIPFRSLEPPPQEEAAYVMKKYPAEQVMLFYVLREAARLRDRRKLPEDELKKAVSQLLTQASKMKGFEAVIPNLEALDAAYRKYWSAPAQWWQAPAEWFDPLRPSSATGGVFTNDINRLSSEYRNLHMYRLLAGAALEGQRVFAVVGRNHVPMQERALRCALE